MQIYGILLNIRGILLNICGILLNICGKSWKIRGKSWNFRGIHSSTSSRMNRFRGRFRSFSVVFPVISGENQRISENFRGKWRI